MLDHLALLEREAAAMTAALGTADPEARVASCPGWTVRDLVTHVAAVHRWATAALGSNAPPPYDEPLVRGDLARGYAAAIDPLLERLSTLSASSPAWTLSRTDRTAGFWRRRQLHEVLVHRWDVCGGELDEQVAADGIAEVVDVLLPRQLALGRTTLPSAGLRLQTEHRAWEIGAAPWTALAGSASELLLRLWGRGAPLPDGWRALTP